MSQVKPITYAFIDSQNLNLGVRSQGWHIDYRRLRAVLEYKKSPKKRNRPPRSVETLGVAGKNIVHQRSVETLGLSRHGDDKRSIAKSHKKVNRKVPK